MKIVYVHHCGFKSGASNSLLYLLEELNRRGNKIYVITQGGSVTEYFKKVTSNVIEVPGVTTFFTAENFGILRTMFINIKTALFMKHDEFICEQIRRIEPDVVHLNEIGMFSLAKKVKRQLGISVVMHARTVPNRHQPLLRYLFNKQVSKYTDKLICISESVNQYYRKQDSITIYNPIHFAEKEFSDYGARDSDQFGSNQFEVLFLSNLLKTKGIKETIDALKILKSKDHIQFTIIGSNVKSDSYFKSFFGRLLDFIGAYRNYEKRLTKAIALNNLNTRYLGQTQNIKDEIAKTDLMIAPMHVNGTPRSVIEAGAQGVPSVLALYNKIDDLVEDGINGFIIEEKSSQQLVEAILRADRDRELLRRMGEKMAFKIKKLCSQNVVADRVEEIYHSLL